MTTHFINKGIRLESDRGAFEFRYTHYAPLFGTPWLYCGLPWLFWLTWHNYHYAIGTFGVAFLRILGVSFRIYWESRNWKNV